MAQEMLIQTATIDLLSQSAELISQSRELNRVEAERALEAIRRALDNDVEF